MRVLITVIVCAGCPTLMVHEALFTVHMVLILLVLVIEASFKFQYDRNRLAYAFHAHTQSEFYSIPKLLLVSSLLMIHLRTVLLFQTGAFSIFLFFPPSLSALMLLRHADMLRRKMKNNSALLIFLSYLNVCLWFDFFRWLIFSSRLDYQRSE